MDSDKDKELAKGNGNGHISRGVLETIAKADRAGEKISLSTLHWPQLTSQLKGSFLKFLDYYGSVREAAEAMGVEVKSLYREKAADDVFSQDWDTILDRRVYEAEEELYERAVAGWKEPVYYRGEIVGHNLKKSDALLKFYLQHEKPEKYSDKAKVEFNRVGTQINQMITLAPGEDQFEKLQSMFMQLHNEVLEAEEGGDTIGKIEGEEKG